MIWSLLFCICILLDISGIIIFKMYLSPFLCTMKICGDSLDFFFIIFLILLHISFYFTNNFSSFSKLFAEFSERKKTKCSPQQTSLPLHGKISMLDYLKVPSLVLCFWFTLMILQRPSLPMQSYWQNTSLFFVVHDTHTSANDLNEDLETGLFNGKWYL